MLNIAGDALNIANGKTRVTISGDLGIARDQAGLANALALQKAVNAIVDALQKEPSLPAKLPDEPAAPTGKTDNPFI
ncbi:hypothetical protein BVER_00779 [Candidatus Burkholderia verschuerenii]|uniref:Uncharacterized protein n=1 Tax=Candidatus Burkholderia verschuerenii TaxID=242163 RepID=A0A0L0MAK4_9BURK|nr:hypothetical protein BVER_00779 [Candidatus Burkholderia verschuerenii]